VDKDISFPFVLLDFPLFCVTSFFYCSFLLLHSPVCRLAVPRVSLSVFFFPADSIAFWILLSVSGGRVALLIIPSWSCVTFFLHCGAPSFGFFFKTPSPEFFPGGLFFADLLVFPFWCLRFFQLTCRDWVYLWTIPPPFGPSLLLT